MSERTKRSPLRRAVQLALKFSLVGIVGAAAIWVWSWRQSQRATEVADAARRFGWEIHSVSSGGRTTPWNPTQGLGSVVEIRLREDLSGDEEWRLLTESFPGLTVVHLRGPLCDAGRMAALAKGTSVQEISLSHSPIDRPLCAALASMPMLDQVDLSSPLNTPSADDLCPLAESKSIRSLTFGNVPLRAKSLAQLPPTLNRLLLSRTGTSDAELGELASAVTLEELALRGLPVTDGGLSILKQLPALRTLLVGDCQIKGSGLASAQGLETLTIIGCPLDDRGVDEICRLPKLEWLDVWNSDLSDQGIERLTQLANLESLRIKGEQAILSNSRDVGRLRAASPIKQLFLGR